MREWRKIFCAVDLSEPSRVAMEQAVDLAKRFQSELTLVHVVVLPPPAASNVLVSSRELAQIEAQENEETLERWRADAERKAGFPVRKALVAGDPAGDVVRYAREEGCDLLVVGTHGRSGLRRLVLGSVAERVIRHAHCAVLVVRDSAELEREAVTEETAPYR